MSQTQQDAEQPETPERAETPEMPERSEQAGTPGQAGAAEQADSAEDATAGGAAEDADPAAGTTAQATAEERPLPSSLAFRINPVSLLAVLAIAACATPLATTAGPWALLVYLIPLAIAVWILRTRTTVGPDEVRTRTVFGGKRFTWDEVVSLRLDEKRWLKAVLRSGDEVVLPAIRVRDLPRLAVMSGGRLTDPATAE
ncbi:PH domain-containing protein [Saccharopolyspora cebuensis]|uniref:PH domain-containing protein n=1 Tax=Saccharopolyspora cebuensis TaxID=418759 RepID=A0ABV4CDB4_9PSEU